MTADTQIDPLLELSARLGANPLLVQAGTGNTSVKTDGVLWVKASGKWLAHAEREEILVSIDLAETRRQVARNTDPAGQCHIVGGRALVTSVETAMHAVLPHRIVLHVHSVNTIAWAVRRDAPERLTERLGDLRWKFIPYVSSGLPLARAISHVIEAAPDTDVLILGNHGLVVCGDDCAAAGNLLEEVERRLMRAPRRVPADLNALTRLSVGTSWKLPTDETVHVLGADPHSAAFLSRGVIYPCQAIFLAPSIPACPQREWSDTQRFHLPQPSLATPFIVIEGAGVLVDERITPPAEATLSGLAHVLSRVEESAQLRYLNEPEVDQLLTADSYRYRELVETSSGVFAA